MRKFVGAVVLACSLQVVAQVREPELPRANLATENFGADAPWFARNIPFLEIDDATLERIYYYRWKLYRSHLREIGTEGTMVTEFLPEVPWGRRPFTDLNDSSAFHLMEGRWLRDPSVVDDLIDHLYAGGGNDRHFSEWIAAATEASTNVTADTSPALRNLDGMKRVFGAWDDHLDKTRNLYWIEPLRDATEYTISSIDASGAGFSDGPSKDQNHNGFTGGWAYRPSINSYQYANAKSIARLAQLAGEADTAAEYERSAEKIRNATVEQLWDARFQHFIDRYQRSTPSVTAGEFIRGRELVGYTPWMFDLPPVDPNTAFNVAWNHALNGKELGGLFGLRTVEPTYPRYMTQYRYDKPTGLPECQWNGPSWPFQTSEALMAMANLLEDYPGSDVTKDDYLRLLRQYAQQHVDTKGKLDLQEDYSPDTGKPIVGLPRSHHYNHSTFVDLVINGLIGIRPRADEVLEIAPLLPSDGERPIRYFALQRVMYHGHEVGVYFDADGSRYKRGRGLSVFVDGRRAAGPVAMGRIQIPLTKVAPGKASRRVDLAVNVGVKEGPMPTASSSESERQLAEGIDGRMWFFPEIANGWSPAKNDANATSWYAVDLRSARSVGSVELDFFGDGKEFDAPKSYLLQYQTADGWVDVPEQSLNPKVPLANGVNVVSFPAVTVQKVRVVMVNPTSGRVRMVEMKAFAP
jgi:hypothetical protein